MGDAHTDLKYCCALTCWLSASCATAPAPQQQRIIDDPVVVATAWCRTRSLEAADVKDQELAMIIKSWEDPQVLRVFLDGKQYHAVVADGLGDELRQAAILTIAHSEGTWAISHIDSGQTDLLWPTF